MSCDRNYYITCFTKLPFQTNFQKPFRDLLDTFQDAVFRTLWKAFRFSFRKPFQDLPETFRDAVFSTCIIFFEKNVSKIIFKTLNEFSVYGVFINPHIYIYIYIQGNLPKTNFPNILTNEQSV